MPKVFLKNPGPGFPFESIGLVVTDEQLLELSRILNAFINTGLETKTTIGEDFYESEVSIVPDKEK